MFGRPLISGISAPKYGLFPLYLFQGPASTMAVLIYTDIIVAKAYSIIDIYLNWNHGTNGNFPKYSQDYTCNSFFLN